MEPSYRAGKPTIWAAARVGDNATLWKGLETIPVDKPDADGRSALHWAVSCNRTELVEALLSRGANALVRDELGWMPLHSAGSVGNVRILQKLVEAAGSDECINIKSTDAAEVSILHLVCSKGRLECLEWLLEQQGIEMEAEDADQATPLHRAACAGHMACVDLLVERGADINNQDCNGNSSLHVVLSSQDVEAAKLLLARGADPLLLNHAGNAPVDFLEVDEAKALARVHNELKRRRGERARTEAEMREMEKEAQRALLEAPREPAYTLHDNCGLNVPGEEHDESMCTHVYY